MKIPLRRTIGLKWLRRRRRQRLEFAVSGMTCDHCAETVARTLRQLPGVHKAEVNLKKGRAVVTGERLDPQRLTAAVNSLGYEMSLDK